MFIINSLKHINIFSIKFKTFLLIFLTFVTFFSFSENKDPLPKVAKGVLDVKGVDFDTTKKIALDGEWEFYPFKEYAPEDFRLDNLNNEILKNKTFTIVPSPWNNNKIKEKKMGGRGYATYRLRIINLPRKRLGLKMNCINTAYKLWLNDKEIIEMGKIGKDKKSSFPKVIHKEIYFDPTSDKIEIIINVANYFHKNGGIMESLFIGANQNIIRYKFYNVGIELFLLGGILIMGFYQLMYIPLILYTDSDLYFTVTYY